MSGYFLVAVKISRSERARVVLVEAESDTELRKGARGINRI